MMGHDMFARLPNFVKVWFLLDLVLALSPPLHWALGTAEPIHGVPRSLVYIYGVAIVVAASVVVAYVAGREDR